jgi:hypothetical protein
MRDTENNFEREKHKIERREAPTTYSEFSHTYILFLSSPEQKVKN